MTLAQPYVTRNQLYSLILLSLFRYRDDEDDLEGSGEEEDSYRERDGGGYNTHRLQEESIDVVS